eukprot:gene19086-25687_t
MDHIFITPFNSPRGGATDTVPPNLSRNSNDGYNRVLRPSISYSIRSPLGVSLDTGRAKSVRGQSTPPTPITSYAFSDAPQSGPTKTSALSPARTPPASPLAYTRIVNNPSGVAGARTASSSTKTRGVLYSAVRPSTAGTAGGGGGGGNAGGMAAVASGNVVQLSASTRPNLGVSGMQVSKKGAVYQ